MLVTKSFYYSIHLILVVACAVLFSKAYAVTEFSIAKNRESVHGFSLYYGELESHNNTNRYNSQDS